MQGNFVSKEQNAGVNKDREKEADQNIEKVKSRKRGRR